VAEIHGAQRDIVSFIPFNNFSRASSVLKRSSRGGGSGRPITPIDQPREIPSAANNPSRPLSFLKKPAEVWASTLDELRPSHAFCVA